LRAGLVTSAAAAGASERAIMAQTGHRSVTMVRKYIREGSLFRENAAAVVGLRAARVSHRHISPTKGGARSTVRSDLAPDSCWYALCATIIGNRGKPSGESRLRKSIDSASECNLRPVRTFTSTFAIHCSHWQWSPKGGP